MASLLLFPPLAAFGFAFEVCTTQKPQNLINVAPPAPRSSSLFPQQKRVAVEARLACSVSQILGSDSSSATASALGVLSFSGGKEPPSRFFPGKKRLRKAKKMERENSRERERVQERVNRCQNHAR